MSIWARRRTPYATRFACFGTPQPPIEPATALSSPAIRSCPARISCWQPMLCVRRWKLRGDLPNPPFHSFGSGDEESYIGRRDDMRVVMEEVLAEPALHADPPPPRSGRPFAWRLHRPRPSRRLGRTENAWNQRWLRSRPDATPDSSPASRPSARLRRQWRVKTALPGIAVQQGSARNLR